MKQQDKLGFQNGARNALKMFEIVIDIRILCTLYVISGGRMAAHCSMRQKPYKQVSSNYTDFWAMKKSHLGKPYVYSELLQ